MKVIKISVDEQNREHSLTLENGKTYYGLRALNGIKIKKMTNEDGKESLEAHVDWDYIKRLRK